MTIILTTIAIIGLITIIPTMTIFAAYEICPMDRMPNWLNNAYHFIADRL